MKFFIFYFLYLFIAFKFKFQKVIYILYHKKILFYSLKFKLDYNNFINMNIYNRRYKKNHLQIVTNNYSKIIEIIHYLKSNLKKIKIIERNTLIPFDTNSKGNIKNNINFWSQGNNFYIYNVIYEFKKNVISYKNINNYIEQEEYMIYSNDYYKHLESFDDTELEIYLFFNTFYVTNNSFKHGYHRIFAMIGRLIKNKKYLPIYVINKN